MKKRIIVISLGGSIIIPDNINISVLKSFKKVINKNTKKYKFVIVTGGGSLARKYIKAIQKTKADYKMQNFAGIAATRCNARFMSYFFNIDPKKGIPLNMREVKKQISKQNIVFCGALGYKPKQTSDSAAAEIARQLKADFVNLTNVAGLYNKDPTKNKNAKFISKITWKKFDKMASKLKYKPGQHFVLDQTASKIIMKNKITTYLLGKNMKQLHNLLNNKNFKGTIIQG